MTCVLEGKPVPVSSRLLHQMTIMRSCHNPKPPLWVQHHDRSAHHREGMSIPSMDAESLGMKLCMYGIADETIMSVCGAMAPIDMGGHNHLKGSSDNTP